MSKKSFQGKTFGWENNTMETIFSDEQKLAEKPGSVM